MKPRFDPLLALRGFAATCVMLGHMQFPGVYVATALGNVTLWYFFADGHVFVGLFYIFSGYLSTKVFATARYTFTLKSILSFYRGRIIKIVPLYYLFIGIGIIRGTLLPERHFGQMLFQFLTFHAQDKFAFRAVDYRWVISNEMTWYLLSPIVSFFVIKLLRGKKNYDTYLYGSFASHWNTDTLYNISKFRN